MSTAAIVALVVAGTFFVIVLVATFAMLIQRFKQMVDTLQGLREELVPTLDSLRRDAEVARQELERVSEAADAIGEDDQRPVD